MEKEMQFQTRISNYMYYRAHYFCEFTVCLKFEKISADLENYFNSAGFRNPLKYVIINNCLMFSKYT